MNSTFACPNGDSKMTKIHFFQLFSAHFVYWLIAFTFSTFLLSLRCSNKGSVVDWSLKIALNQSKQTALGDEKFAREKQRRIDDLRVIWIVISQVFSKQFEFNAILTIYFWFWHEKNDKWLDSCQSIFAEKKTNSFFIFSANSQHACTDAFSKSKNLWKQRPEKNKQQQKCICQSRRRLLYTVLLQQKTNLFSFRLARRVCATKMTG